MLEDAGKTGGLNMLSKCLIHKIAFNRNEIMQFFLIDNNFMLACHECCMWG